ncbi:hypothetical protein BIY23_02525 [Wolbachia pipientis]|uniref:AsmA-like C-terminal domain-containing protein n=1 Tax=Wolbachia pipientis TaxID=955 RepID=A0A1E7QJQ2_WOLPI|nr:hypothetical protein [Wolbachia pipientis]OEY86711.1 hypothetical protein BIY23_02525 [Wolbachia pipientis]
MKFSIYAILSIVLIIFIAHITILFKDWNGYKEYIAQELKKAYDAEIYIGGKVKFSLITPKVTIHNVYIQYGTHKEQHLSALVNVDKIEIRPVLLALSLQPKSITLFNMKCNKKNLFHIINVKANADFIIKDSCIDIEDNTVSIKEMYIKKNKKFTGNIKVNDYYYNFSGKINDKKKNLNIVVESNLVNLVFKGNKAQEKLNGQLELTVNNNSNTVSNLMKLFKFNLPLYFIPNESIHILSNVLVNKDEFLMTDLNINSDSVQASGIIHNDRKSNHTNIIINFSKIIMKNNPNIDIKELLECFKNSIPKNLNLNLDLKAPSVNSQEKKILDNFSTSVKFSNGQATINILFKLSGANKLSNMSGTISSNDILSEFDGELNVTGRDFRSLIQYFSPSMIIQENEENEENEFALYSQLHLGPRILSMSDISLSVSTPIDKEFLKGAIKINYTKKHNVVGGRINIHNLNINRYNNLIHLSRTRWLKNFKYNIHIKTVINDLTLNNIKIKNLDFLLKIKKHKLAANQIKIEGEDFNMTGDVQLSLEQKHTKPLLDIHLTGTELNGNIIALQDLIEKTNNPRQKIQWSTQKLDFLNNIEHFDANIHIDAQKFQFREKILKDFNLDAFIEHGTVKIRQANYELENGKVLFQGYLKPDSINTSFSISDLEITGIDNITGLISLMGTIKTYGQSIINWADNCSGEITLGARELKFSGLNLNGLIVNLLSNNKTEITKFIQIDVYKGDTIFNDIIAKTDIKGGICSTSLQFNIDQASGSGVANFALSNFILHSKLVLFFIPQNYSNPVQFEMYLDGPIWLPTIHFETDKILAMLKQ